MNELIQQLAVKAKLMAEEDINRQISYKAELKAFAEKFAELIIRECSDVAANAHGIREAQGHSVSKQIKEHFGVEK